MKIRAGFTIVEVALFIAITGLLFAGIVAGTRGALSQQRFYDSVQTFAEFLRSAYSEVSNPQSVGEGRSETAIYGKLITFGEEYGRDLEPISSYEDLAQRIFVYDVVGKTDSATSGSAQDVLEKVEANVVRIVATWDGTNDPKEIAAAGEEITFSPRWGASIETTAKALNPGDNLFTGSILVVRHPRSGTINTLVSSKVVEVNKTVMEANEQLGKHLDYTYENLLSKYFDKDLSAAEGRFISQEVDFCINPAGDTAISELRWDVRLVNNARNASGVEVIDLDLNETMSGEQVGNRCRFAADL